MTKDIVRRLYVYAAAFLGLQLLLAGARGVLDVIIEALINPSAVGGANQFTSNLSLSLALIICGLPLWAGHWWWAQRSIRTAAERKSGLRRLYCYLVLLIAMLSLLFDLQTLLGLLLAPGSNTLAQPLIGTMLINGLVWIYHWNVLRTDRLEGEQTNAPATLRRWYLYIIQATSLGLASFAAVGLLHLLLQTLVTTPLGTSSGVGQAIASLLAGLSVWLPHHLWARRLIRRDTSLRPDELGSTLRQVYAALIVTVAAVAALGGLTALLYAILSAAFGGITWRSVLVDNTQAVAIALIGGVVWWYHRAQLLNEAHQDTTARDETAQRIIGYLTAAIGLGALYFGLGGLLGTLLRLLLAPAVIGTGWRDAMSLNLALSIVALPVYGLAAQAMERKSRISPDEEHSLARRIYLYTVLLFGIAATITSIVVVVRLALSVVLGSADAGWLGEFGRWLGYAVLGGVIAALYTLLLRRSSRTRGDAGAHRVIAIIANEPLLTALVTALAQELPGATIQTVGEDEVEVARLVEIITGADTLLVPLRAALSEPTGRILNAFPGQRLLLVTNAPGYEVIGLLSDAENARSAARTIRSKTPAAPHILSTVPVAGSTT